MFILELTPTITAGSYSSGDALGGKLQFNGAPGKECLIHTVIIIDKAQQKKQIRLALFDSDFTATTDNAAMAITAGEEGKLAHIIKVPASAYEDIGSDVSVARVEGLSLPYIMDVDYSTIFGQLIVDDTPTYTATDDIIIKLGVLPYRG